MKLIVMCCGVNMNNVGAVTPILRCSQCGKVRVVRGG
jgi:hypothetical protein